MLRELPYFEWQIRTKFDVGKNTKKLKKKFFAKMTKSIFYQYKLFKALDTRNKFSHKNIDY
jgi:hypothetical protein